jgi:hypothetical protein
MYLYAAVVQYMAPGTIHWSPSHTPVTFAVRPSPARRWLECQAPHSHLSLSSSSFRLRRTSSPQTIHPVCCSLFCSLRPTLLAQHTGHTPQAARADAVCRNMAVPAPCTSATLHRWTHTYHPCSVPAYLDGTIPGNTSVKTWRHGTMGSQAHSLLISRGTSCARPLLTPGRVEATLIWFGLVALTRPNTRIRQQSSILPAHVRWHLPSCIHPPGPSLPLVCPDSTLRFQTTG